MKSILSVFVLLLSISFVHAQTTEVQKVVSDFVKAADEQDPKMLEKTMHESAIQHVLFGPNLLTSNRSEYVAQIEAKRLGGQPRETSFEETVVTSDSMATVKVIAKSSVLRFDYHITLLKKEGAWKISSINAVVQRL